jgi:flagellar motor switch protein FliM
MDQILSQEEIDALLSAVDSGAIPEPAAVTPPPAASRTVVRYNFRKPNRVSKDQVKMLQSIHESFARLYSGSLSTLSRSIAEMKLKSVEQITYGEFSMAFSPPTCVAIFTMDPLPGGALLEISADVLFLLIDRMLGGSGYLPMKPREFTQVEQVLIERVSMRAMVDLQQTWQHAGTFGFRVARLETNPQFVQLTSPSEVMVVVTFGLRVGEVNGQLTLAYPHLLLEPVMPKLNAQRYLAAAQREASPQEGKGLETSVLQADVVVRGVLAEAPISIRDLLALKPGMVLKLRQHVNAPAVIDVEGIPRFTGQPGVSNRRRALRVNTVINKGGSRDAGIGAGTARVFVS